MAWLDGPGTWKARDQIVGEEIWARGMWIVLSELAKKAMKISVSYAPQRLTSAEEDFNNQKDRMTCSVDTSQSFPRHHCIAQWARGQSVHGGRDGGDASALQHGPSLTQPSDCDYG